MKKKTLLKEVLIDYVRLYYLDVLNNIEKKNALKIFEALLDENIEVSDFIPIMRQIQFDLDMAVMA
jgi:pyruvate kinase